MQAGWGMAHRSPPLSASGLLPAAARRLVRDDRGASLIEFTLLVPFLSLLLIGIADYSRGFADRFALESAAHRTLERAGVGSSQSGYDYLRAEAANAASVPIEQVFFDKWLECGGTRMPGYDDPCDDGRQIARYIYVRIERDFELSFNWPGRSRIMRLAGDAAVRVQ